MGLKLHPDIRAEIIQHYSQRHGAPADLIELSNRLGIPRPDICSVAGAVGLTDKHRPKPNPQLRGSNNPRWIPDQELRHDDSGRRRARKTFTLPDLCERCHEVPPTDRHHKDSNPLNNVPSNVAFLCRRCHMEEDGRLAALISSAPHFIAPLRPCSNCSVPSKPLRRGICHRCNESLRRNGILPAVELRCADCGVVIERCNTRFRCNRCQREAKRVAHMLGMRERRLRTI